MNKICSTNRRAAARRVLAVAAAAVVSFVLADGPSRAFGQTTATWVSPVNGNWTDATKWSSNPNYPDNGNPSGSHYDVAIGVTGAAYTVTLGSLIHVDTFLLNSTSGTVNQTVTTFQVDNIRLSAGTYNLSGGADLFCGSFTVDASGLMNFTQGTIESTGGQTGHVANGGTLNVSGSTGTRRITRPMDNAGLVAIGPGSSLDIGVGSFNNFLNGTLRLDSSSLNFFLSGGTLNNVGTVLIAGTGVSSLNLDTSNAGTINITSGGLIFGASNTFTQQAGARVVGAGTLDLGSAMNVIAGAATFSCSDITMGIASSGGDIEGSGDLNITTKFHFDAGTLKGAGKLIIRSGALLDSPAPGIVRAIQREVDNSGTIKATGTLIFDGGTFKNQSDGVINLLPGSSLFNNFPTAGEVTNSGTISVNAGTTSAVGTLDVGLTNNGTINVAGGTLVFGASSPMTHSLNSSISGAGTLDIQSGGQNITGNTTWDIASIYLNGGSIGGTADLTIGKALHWNSGTIGGGGGRVIVASGATLDTGTTGFKLLDGELDNQGTTTLSNGSVALGLGSLNNATGGVLNFNNGGGIGHFGSGNGQLVNAGTFNVNAAAGGSLNLSFNVALTNSGTISVNSGTFALPTSVATMHQAGSWLRGAGFIDLGQGTQQINGSTTFAGNTYLTGGTISLASAPLSISGDLHWNSGTISGTGSMTVASGGTLDITGSGVTHLLTSTLTNSAGTINLSGAALSLNNGTLVNGAGGWFTIDANSNETIGLANASTFSNAGTFFVNGTGGASFLMSAPFANSGTINALANATFTGSITHLTGSIVEGLGRIDLLGPTQSFVGNTTLAGIFMNTGSTTIYTGAANATVTGELFFNAGTFQGIGKLSIAIGGEIDAGATSSAATPTLSRLLENSGSLDLDTGTLAVAGGTISNLAGGIIKTINSPQITTTAGNGTLINAGTIDIGAGLPLFQTALNNTGTINVGASGAAGASQPTISGAVTQLGTNHILTGGAWNLLNGSKINLSSIGTNQIFTNQAFVTLDGPTAVLNQLGNALNNNSGTLRIIGGATFNPSGAFTNSGSLFVGGGSTFTFNTALNGGAGTITSDGQITIQSGIASSAGHLTGAGTLFVSGGTTLTADQLRVGTISILHSTVVRINPGLGDSGVTHVGTLLLEGGTNPAATLDLNDNDLIATATPLATITGQITHAYNGGTWTREGITSSAAAAVAANSGNMHKTALGYATASSIGVTSFAGQTVSGTDVLVRYTFSGDANLDDAVNSNDFTALAAHFNTSGQLWTAGDFNYDGFVNALDFNALAVNFGQVLPAPALGTLIPEPTAFALASAMLGLARRRRR